MVHSIVFVIFIQSICFPLILYGQIQYGIVVFIILSVFLLYKFIFHISYRLFFLLFYVFVSLFLYQYYSYRINDLNIAYKSGFISNSTEKSNVVASIKEFPGYRFSNNQYVVLIQDSQTQVLIFTETYKKFAYGDVLNIKGNLQDVREQDVGWHLYYKKLGVHYVLFNPEISKVKDSTNSDFFERTLKNLFEFKLFLRAIILDVFSSHASALVLGMLLGEKDELSKEEKETFNKVGLSHILVVSGYNISLVISFIFIVLKNIDKKVRIISVLIFITLFVLLVGADGSVVRAALMGSIILFSKITLRPASAINVLFIAASVMLCINPLSIFDAGFHLSCIATFSLLIIPRIKKVPEFILVSIWVFVFVSPYILYLSGYVSVGSVLSNILVVLFLPVFMFASLISIILRISTIFIGVDVFIVEVLARYIFFVSDLIEQIPRLEINITPPFLVVLYSLFCLIFIFYKNKYTTIEFIEMHYQKFVPQRSN